MKRVIFTVLLFMLLCIFTQGIVFADEIYQDENGVWTNIPRSGNSAGSGNSGKNGNIVSEGLNAV